MYKLIFSQVAHLERSGHYLTVKDNQVSELVVELEDHIIRLGIITKCPLGVNTLPPSLVPRPLPTVRRGLVRTVYACTKYSIIFSIKSFVHFFVCM